MEINEAAFAEMLYRVDCAGEWQSATTIYVTHDQVEAMTLASKIVVLNLGRVEQVGTPLDL